MESKKEEEEEEEEYGRKYHEPMCVHSSKIRMRFGVRKCSVPKTVHEYILYVYRSL